MIPLQSYLTWAVIVTFFHLAAFGSTTFRLFQRQSTRRMWWDDYMAALALAVDLMYFVVLWIRYKFSNPQHTILSRVILFWLSSLSFFIIVWSARISLALSLTRLLQHEQRKMRIFTKVLAVIFGIIGIALVLQVAIVCGSDSSWHSSVNVQCSGITWISALTTDVIADISLIATPLIMFWCIPLPSTQRHMVLCVFTASILTCLASITLHTFLLGASEWGAGAGMLVLFMSHIEATIALCVANSLIVVGYFYRRLRRNESLDEGEEYDEKTQVPTFMSSTLHKQSSLE